LACQCWYYNVSLKPETVRWGEALKPLHSAAFSNQTAPENLNLSPPAAWIASHLNILVLGPTGSEKTFTTCSLGNAATMQRYSVRSFHNSCFLRPLELARQRANDTTLR